MLTPKKTPGGWHHEAKGDWELLPNQKSVILMVARDGSEQNYTVFRTKMKLVLER